jgi:cyclophilin family peptidyl-prolyl cis-trans isomerase
MLHAASPIVLLESTLGFGQLDGKHVAFGRVIEGLALIRKIDMLGSDDGKPKNTITIVGCGQL